MGLIQRVLSAYTGGTNHFTPRVTYYSPSDLAMLMTDPTSLSPAQLWRTQPQLRTVVSFVARNIAQLGLHSFIREDNTDRRRDRESVVARTLANPNPETTTYELIYALMVDHLLYDKAYWWVAPSADSVSGWTIRRVPPTWLTVVPKNPFETKAYRVITSPTNYIDIPPENILAFSGFSPDSPAGESPAIETLKETLKEQIESARYRGQIWKRGGRVSSVLQRPIDAPRWSDAARNTFREDWHSKFTGSGPYAGGTPILEDGMTLNRIDFSAKEQQFVEAAKLALSTVASAYHVNPTMVGQLDNANYSNVREFRKMLYGDTLGPTLAQVEGRLNTFLIPKMGLDNQEQYLEFNIAEKLQGNFEEQTQAMQTSVGGPWMTINEARAKVNMPAIEGGDVLIRPANLQYGSSTGGTVPAEEPPEPIEEASALPHYRAISAQASKRKPERASVPPRSVKSNPVDEELLARYRADLGKFWAHQAQVLRSKIGAGSDWWDQERWDRELTKVLGELHMMAATEAGRRALDALDIDPDDYDRDRTEAFLMEAAERSGHALNLATKDHIDQAMDDDDIETPVAAVDSVLGGEALESRIDGTAVTAVTFAAGFGTIEAARQQSDEGVTKTWFVTSGNPRASHAAMDGETVGIDEDFSNGMPWPGAGGDAEETAYCQCMVEVTVP